MRARPPRQPISAMPWHGEDGCGIVVVCDDGTIWRYCRDTKEWQLFTVVPDSLAAKPTS